LFGRGLFLLRRPVQRDRGDEEEENDEPHIGEETQDDAAQRFLV
jgi:hypothetical protein